MRERDLEEALLVKLMLVFEGYSVSGLHLDGCVLRLQREVVKSTWLQIDSLDVDTLLNICDLLRKALVFVDFNIEHA